MARFQEGEFRPTLRTAAHLNIDVEASDKVTARVNLGFSGSLNENYLVGSQVFNQLLDIHLISLTAGVPFESAIYVEFFSGAVDYIGDGDTFERIFNVSGIQSFYRGYQYFQPNSLYTGLHEVDGTGLVFSTEFGTDTTSLRWYIYRNPPLFDPIVDSTGDILGFRTIEYNAFSTDLRLMAAADRLAFDVYAGVTYRATNIDPVSSQRGILPLFHAHRADV